MGGVRAMLIDKTWVTVTKKFNLGNYEAIELSASMSGALDNGENPQESIDTLFSICDEAILNRLPKAYKKLNPTYKERFFKFGSEVSKEEMTQVEEE